MTVVPGETRMMLTLFWAVLGSVCAGVDPGASPDKRHLQAALSQQEATRFCSGWCVHPRGAGGSDELH